MPKYTICLADGTALPLTFEADDFENNEDDTVTTFYLNEDIVAVIPKTCMVVAHEQ